MTHKYRVSLKISEIKAVGLKNLESVNNKSIGFGQK